MFKKTEFDHIRSEIILLHRQNLTQSVILNRLAHNKIGRKFVYRTIKRYCETGSEIPSKPAGRPRTKRTPGMIKIWDEIPQNMISASCENFFKRCQQCIKAGGK